MKFDDRKSEAIAQELLGFQFQARARGENKEIDCYGVLIYYYRQFGIELPDYEGQDDWGEDEDLILSEYGRRFRKLGPEEKPEVGDMIITVNSEKSPSHVGVCLSEKRFIHSYVDIGTKIDRWTDDPWKQKIYGFFRINQGKEEIASA